MEPSDSGLRPSPHGEEGPPSLEYIQAKDLFPPKELVKEEENLQVVPVSKTEKNTQEG